MKKTFNRFVSLLLACTMMLSLAACGQASVLDVPEDASATETGDDQNAYVVLTPIGKASDMADDTAEEDTGENDGEPAVKDTGASNSVAAVSDLVEKKLTDAGVTIGTSTVEQLQTAVAEAQAEYEASQSDDSEPANNEPVTVSADTNGGGSEAQKTPDPVGDKTDGHNPTPNPTPAADTGEKNDDDDEGVAPTPKPVVTPDPAPTPKPTDAPTATPEPSPKPTEAPTSTPKPADSASKPTDPPKATATPTPQIDPGNDDGPGIEENVPPTYTYTIVTHEATCEEQGYTEHICNEDASKSFNDGYVDAIGHNWGDARLAGVTTVELTCANCGQTKTEDVSGGYEVVEVPATCEGYGAIEHRYADYPQFNSVEAVAPTGHSWDDGVESKAASCTEDGVKTFTCGNCGQTYTEVIPSTGHYYSAWAVSREPEVGVEGEESCTCYYCGDTKTKSIPAKPAPHEHVYVVQTIPATCTEDGREQKICACGDSEIVTLPALGHNYKDGKCARCGEPDPDYKAPTQTPDPTPTPTPSPSTTPDNQNTENTEKPESTPTPTPTPEVTPAPETSEDDVCPNAPAIKKGRHSYYADSHECRYCGKKEPGYEDFVYYEHFTDAVQREIIDGVYNGTNDVRDEIGTGRLKYADYLQELANERARELLSDFSHYYGDPSHPGTYLEDLMDKYGYEFDNMSENNGRANYYFSKGKNFAEGWSESPGHFNTQVSSDWTSTVVGVAYDPETDMIYVVQIFVKDDADPSTISLDGLNGLDMTPIVTLSGDSVDLDEVQELADNFNSAENAVEAMEAAKALTDTLTDAVPASDAELADMPDMVADMNARAAENPNVVVVEKEEAEETETEPEPVVKNTGNQTKTAAKSNTTTNTNDAAAKAAQEAARKAAEDAAHKAAEQAAADEAARKAAEQAAAEEAARRAAEQAAADEAARKAVEQAAAEEAARRAAEEAARKAAEEAAKGQTDGGGETTASGSTDENGYVEVWA